MYFANINAFHIKAIVIINFRLDNNRSLCKYLHITHAHFTLDQRSRRLNSNNNVLFMEFKSMAKIRNLLLSLNLSTSKIFTENLLLTFLFCN